MFWNEMLYWWKPLTLSHQTGKIGGFRYCGGGDLTLLVCHMILLEHMVKGSYSSFSGNPNDKLPSFQVWWLQVSW